MEQATVRDLNLRDRRVLLRTDYNVPVSGSRVRDDLRIEASIPTIQHLRTAGARVAILTHRGRPGGTPDPDQSTQPIAAYLGRYLGTEVRAAPDCVGPQAEAAVDALGTGEVVVLENVRFHRGEEANDPEFAQRLADLADVYVNDAFGAIHRAHASIVGVPRLLPAAAGLLVEREVDRLREVEDAPERPLALVLGGAKVSDKLPLLQHVLPAADVVCLGGAVANAVLRAQGVDVAASVTDGDAARDAAQRLRAELDRRPDLDLVVPTDVMVAPRPGSTDEARLVPVHQIPRGWAIVDVGPETIRAFEAALAGTRTAIWNGPIGIFEHPPFDLGTRAMARILAHLHARTVVGGGETVSAVRAAGWADRIWHVSTGGGAALHLLSGRPLPGLEALPRRAPNPGPPLAVAQRRSAS